ncbi:MAG: hypothetical protein NTV88_03235 [Candidatus Micrarchaeota archaeon]|nr:hypothetical protein [Candidatus Micrarchaeota archaeon]
MKSLIISVSASNIVLTARRLDNIDSKLIFGNKLDVKVPSLAQPWNELIKIDVPLKGGQPIMQDASLFYSAYALAIPLKEGRNVSKELHSHLDTVNSIARELERHKWSVEDRYSGSYPQYQFIKLIKDDVSINRLPHYISFTEAYKEKVLGEMKNNPGGIPSSYADGFIGAIIGLAEKNAKEGGALFHAALKSLDGFVNYLKAKGFSVDLKL